MRATRGRSTRSTRSRAATISPIKMRSRSCAARLRRTSSSSSTWASIFFATNDGKLGTRAFGGACKARTYFVADITGQALANTLYDHDPQGRRQDPRRVVRDEPLRGRRHVPGRGRDRHAARRASSLTRQSGHTSPRAAWAASTNRARMRSSARATAIALAYRVGAPLMDMEMVQYHPTTLKGTGFLMTEGARGEGAYLHERRRRALHAALRAEDDGARVARRRVAVGDDRARRGPRRRRMRLSRSAPPRARNSSTRSCRRSTRSRSTSSASTWSRCRSRSGPGMHYIMGGVKTDSTARRRSPGLYAAGECACVSVHGGNRLGANSLLDTLVFGRRAGAHSPTT